MSLVVICVVLSTAIAAFATLVDTAEAPKNARKPVPATLDTLVACTSGIMLSCRDDSVQPKGLRIQPKSFCIWSLGMGREN